MTLFIIGHYIKKSTSSLLFSTLAKDRRIKFNEPVWSTVFCLKCSYHNTPAYFKMEKSDTLRRKLIDRRKKIMNKPIAVWANMTVTELAITTKRPVEDIIKMIAEFDNNICECDTVLSDFSIIKNVINKIGNNFRDISDKKIKENSNRDFQLEDLLNRCSPDPSVLVKRHPIVTIMGHVDHGKTTLLDSLRMTSVADSEFGGITQHIGAFNVTLSNGEKITFLDTPGHAAFYAMRERGANVTDIVILVVAADDGVMEQTVQSIKMANDADVPIIVAVNKIDLPNIDIDRIHKKLSNHGVLVEDLGGDCQSVNISARNGTNLNHLLDAIVVQSEIMDLKGDPSGPVEGVIIEATNDLGHGKITSLIIQRGSLKKGDVLVSGGAWTKVRSIFDHTGSKMSEAKLSEVVQITGWRDLPIVGDKVYQVESEKKAHLVLKHQQANLSKEKSANQKKIADKKHAEHVVEHKKVMERRLSGIGQKYIKPTVEKKDDSLQLSIIIKGDVVGSVEAILDVLKTYKDDRCALSIVEYGVGSVTATDVELSKTFNAVIYCFNTTIPKSLTDEINKNNIPVFEYNVIYNLIDDIKLKISGKLPMAQKEEIIGEGIVLQQFEVDEKKAKAVIAGCQCTSGVFKKNAHYKISRNDEVVYNDVIIEMKHFKNDVDSLHTKQEGGLKLIEKVKLKKGDIIICYVKVDEPQFVDWDTGF